MPALDGYYKIGDYAIATIRRKLKALSVAVGYAEKMLRTAACWHLKQKTASSGGRE